MYKEQNPRKPIQVVQVYTKNTTERLFSSRWDFDKDFFFFLPKNTKIILQEDRQ